MKTAVWILLGVLVVGVVGYFLLRWWWHNNLPF